MKVDITNFSLSDVLKGTNCRFFSLTSLEMSWFISDEYTFLRRRDCLGEYITRNTTLEVAKAACVNDKECGCIQNYYCNGKFWQLHKGHDVWPSDQNNCAWTLSKMTFPFHNRNIIFCYCFSEKLNHCSNLTLTCCWKTIGPKVRWTVLTCRIKKEREKILLQHVCPVA